MQVNQYAPCSTHFTLEINVHEQTRNEQGLFTYLYHWLVVTDQSTLGDIEDIVGNISHFSAISWETQQTKVVRCKQLILLSFDWVFLY